MRSVLGEMMIALLGQWAEDWPRGMVMRFSGGVVERDLVGGWMATA
jgi:hypothetical protein